MNKIVSLLKLVCVLFTTLLLVNISYAGVCVENFDKGNYNGWKLIMGSEKDRAEIKVVNGELVFKQFNVGTCEDYIALEASHNWQDYILELRFKFGELGPSDPKGVLITYNESFQGIPEGGPNCPFIFIRTPAEFRPELDGSVVGMVARKGNFSTHTSAPFHFEVDNWYNVKIIVDNSHYEIFIDGRKVITYDDNTFIKGGIGMGARDVVAFFDDIRVTGDNVSDMTSVKLSGKTATTWAALKSR